MPMRRSKAARAWRLAGPVEADADQSAAGRRPAWPELAGLVSARTGGGAGRAWRWSRPGLEAIWARVQSSGPGRFSLRRDSGSGALIK